jgi:phytoene synthase
MLQRSRPRAPDFDADLAACRELIRHGSRSFFTASKLLPPDVREPAYALYAFCRLSDDAVDEAGARRDAVQELRRRLDRVYEGHPDPIAADRAFARVAERTALPKALPEALLEGLEWDIEGRRYRTLDDLNAYGARVAGAVGAMMTVLMGVREEAVLARACDLGCAMQLTNIARDVGEDARNGRVYLPLDWLADEGIDAEDFLADPRWDGRIGRIVERLLAAADALYGRSAYGIAGLPVGCRPAIHAARLIYREIGEVIRRSGHDSVSRRAVVPGRRKVALLANAAASAVATPRGGPLGPLPQTAFLVHAVVQPKLPAAAADVPARADSAWTAFDDRVGWVLDLCERLERRRDDLGSSQRAAGLSLDT